MSARDNPRQPKGCKTAVRAYFTLRDQDLENLQTIQRLTDCSNNADTCRYALAIAAGTLRQEAAGAPPDGLPGLVPCCPPLPETILHGKRWKCAQCGRTGST